MYDMINSPEPDSNPALGYQLVSRETGGRSLTVYVPGESPITVTDSHPKFDDIFSGVHNRTLDAGQVRRLHDMSYEAQEQFERITDRVSVAGGHVFFDGDEVHSTLSRQIMRFIEAGVDDWKPLVAFMEKLAQNPTEHSRNQLYDWLSKRDFTITEDGDFIAYKGVTRDEQGNLVSIHSGPGIVNGKAVNGRVPNPTGAVVEIARSKVAFDPAQGCSAGLHVGTYEFAHMYAHGAMLKVKVNPRDVVSVPTECDWQKMRVCRYKVLEQIDAPETEPVAYVNDFAEDDLDEDDWRDDLEEWGREEFAPYV